MSNLSIGILGKNGRMGQALIAEISNNPKITCLTAGRNDSVDKVFKDCDVVLDFTSPTGLEGHLNSAKLAKTPLVIGTTGLNQQQLADIAQAAKTTAILHAPNTSVGVALLMNGVEKAVAALGGDCTIEIVDKHHVHKVDAPSGTALSFASVIKSALNDQEKDIKFSITREGEIPGEHSVIIRSGNEELCFNHKALDRKLFAQGAVKAATWLHGKPAGLYSMSDVLSL